MPRCEFVDPTSNIVCGSTNQITKLVFESVASKNGISIYACKQHGDMRFNVLSRTEDENKKMLDRDLISWNDFKDELANIRWKKCRKNNENMKDQTNFNLNYYAISGNQIRFRRSFMLCVECTLSELRLYGIGKNIQKDQTLDGVIQSLV